MLRMGQVLELAFDHLAGGRTDLPGPVQKAPRRPLAVLTVGAGHMLREGGEQLGVAAMDMEIAEMERRVQVLKKKKEQLGFNQYNDGVLPGSKAKMLVDERTSAARGKVRELGEKKTDVVSQIWTSTTLSQALSILESVKRL